jgi:hypothetical protein
MLAFAGGTALANSVAQRSKLSAASKATEPILVPLRDCGEARSATLLFFWGGSQRDK